MGDDRDKACQMYPESIFLLDRTNIQSIIFDLELVNGTARPSDCYILCFGDM